MDAAEFYELVEKMRHYQKSYFKSKSKHDLAQAKALEREVDNEIKIFNSNQTSLGL